MYRGSTLPWPATAAARGVTRWRPGGVHGRATKAVALRSTGREVRERVVRQRWCWRPATAWGVTFVLREGRQRMALVLPAVRWRRGVPAEEQHQVDEQHRGSPRRDKSGVSPKWQLARVAALFAGRRLHKQCSYTSGRALLAFYYPGQVSSPVYYFFN